MIPARLHLFVMTLLCQSVLTAIARSLSEASNPTIFEVLQILSDESCLTLYKFHRKMDSTGSHYKM